MWMWALQQVKLLPPFEPEFDAGKKGQKDCQYTYERKTGECEQSEKSLKECNTECIDTGIQEPKGLYSKEYKAVYRK